MTFNFALKLLHIARLVTSGLDITFFLTKVYSAGDMRPFFLSKYLACQIA